MDANIEGSLAAEVTMVVLDMLELIVQVSNIILLSNSKLDGTFLHVLVFNISLFSSF